MDQCLLLIAIFSLTISCNGREIPQLAGNSVGPAPNEQGGFDDVPGEPLNPSEFDLAKGLGEDKRQHGSEVYNKEVLANGRFTTERNGLSSSDYRWPKLGQYIVIPYLISSRFDQNKRLFILKAFEDFHKHTCIRFVPRVSQTDYINIVYGEYCDSDVGRIGGEQTISLGKDCDYVDIAIHEINHAVGFYHEQNRPDRDNHIYVYINNVIPESRFNFDKMGYSSIHSFGQKYDTDSIMHYDKWAFSKEYGKLPVMEPKIPNPKMGLAKYLSKTDIVKINLMYKCSAESYGRASFAQKSVSDQKKANDCVNYHSNCTQFVEKTGCTNLWVKANCKEACDMCQEDCMDLHPECETWSLNGACDEHADYMSLYCAKSCFKC